MVKTYKVAGHCFSIEAGNDFLFWKKMNECYGPFEILESECVDSFVLRIDDAYVDSENKSLVYSNRNNVQKGFVTFSVFKTQDNKHYFEISQPNSIQTNGCMNVSCDLSKATLKLSGTKMEQWNTFNTAVSLCFQLFTFCHDTLLLHASAVEYKGRAYLFLGKSGTGKSTHSRMWCKALNGVTLMNDDHPVVRVSGNHIMAYGSPWSGKTPCYKNLQFPLGGIIRIVRAPHNRAVRLSAIQSYGSIMTSCGGMVWEKNLADGRDMTIQNIITHIPCWNMECLPEEDAAKECSKIVTEEWENRKN